MKIKFRNPGDWGNDMRIDVAEQIDLNDREKW